MTTLAERLGHDADAKLAHRELRRPRLVAVRQRRRVRRTPHRRGDERHVDGSLPVGPRRGCVLAWRGRRRAPHAQRRVGDLPLGPDHPGTEPARRRRRLPADASRTPGITPTSRRCAASAGHRWSGRSSGASTSATSTATWGRSSCAPSSSTSTSSSPSTSVCHCGWARPSGEKIVGLPLPRARRGRRRRVPRPARVLPRCRRARHVERALFDLRPGVTEVYLHPAVDTDELRASHPDWAGRGRGPRLPLPRPLAARPHRASRRNADRLSGAPRAPARLVLGDPADLLLQRLVLGRHREGQQCHELPRVARRPSSFPA